ncbi:MAG: hypothetical protein P8Z76_08820 [Alphaproteobacteria bacterium]
MEYLPSSSWTPWSFLPSQVSECLPASVSPSSVRTMSPAAFLMVMTVFCDVVGSV